MAILNYATRDVLWVRPHDSIDKAISLMEERGIHHLPVVRDGQVVGILSDRDILLAVGWRLSSERRADDGPNAPVLGPREVEEIMTHPVESLDPNESLLHAVHVLVRLRIGALPVLRDGVLMGILSETDVLRSLKKEHAHLSVRHLLGRPLREMMTANLTTVGPKTNISQVLAIFRSHRIRHLPVTSDGDLIGIISDRDVRRALGVSTIMDAAAQEKGKLYEGPQTAIEIMTRCVQCAPLDATLGDAIDLLLENHIHCLPVVDHGRLVGIFTATDVMNAVSRSEVLA
ncbi:MAG: CBS domain-containing protein [Phycisphaerales bacterium]|nr:CBS domain-containing protein [Phycisphaerales bacterium]